MEENKLTLEMVVRAYKDYSKNFYIDRGDIISSFGSVYLYNDSSVEKKKKIEDERKKYEPLPESVSLVIDMIKAAEGKDYALDIFNIIEFVLGAFRGSEEKGILLLDRLTKPEFFKDQDLVYSIAELFARGERRSVIQERAYNILASNKNATAMDIANTLWYSDYKKIPKILDAVFEKAREDITKEMSKQGPDAKKLKELVGTPDVAILIAKKKLDNFILDDAFRQEIGKRESVAHTEFDYYKIVSGGSEYFPEYEEKQSQKLSEQVASLQDEVESLKKAKASLQSNLDRTNAEKRILEGENEDLATRLEQSINSQKSEREAKEKAEREVKLLRAQIEMLQKAANDKSLFGGKKKLREAIDAAVERANAVEL